MGSVRITDQPLSTAALADAVRRPEAGAIVVFEGTTRTVERLDYEAYVEMAQRKMEEIVASVIERHSLAAAAAEHRIGQVPLSQPSVVVAVSAGHRGPAFAGARELIDRIKAEAPIWKKEVDDGRSTWVEGSKPPQNPL